MAFVSAMNTINRFECLDLSDSDYETMEISKDDQDYLSEKTTKVGVRGSDVYTEKGFGDKLVSFYTMLNRNMHEFIIKKHMNDLLNADNITLIDLLVLIFQTRDIRGGKGERDLFVHMLTAFLNKFPDHAYEILIHVPEYGYWKDLWEIYKHVESPVKTAIDRVVKEQFTKDLGADRPSLLAKWLPREKSHYDLLAKRFAEVLFPDINKDKDEHLRAYRKAVADLNRKLVTTEINMCGKTWANIVPGHVPGRLMKKNKGAFLNRPTKKQLRKEYGSIEYRYPNDSDRMNCRENFENYAKELSQGKKVAKGANVIMPHELVEEIRNRRHSHTEDSDTILQAQWEAIRNDTKVAGGLNKCVFMCDFSGSMEGTPKDVSLALGILGSEIAHKDFADYILLFDENPSWHCFTGRRTLRDKVNSVCHLGQGLSTDFQKAYDLVLGKLIEHKVPPSEAPTDLIVLTDMGFDEASSTRQYAKRSKVWETHFDIVKRSFKQAGYKPPRIVCWNLRAEYNDFHCKYDTVGVINLSGWSPSAFKALQKGGPGILTPIHMFRTIMDAPRYNPIRELATKLFSF
jgi:hypothetical protein